MHNIDTHRERHTSSSLTVFLKTDLYSYKHHHIILNHLLLDVIHPLVLKAIINNKTQNFGHRIGPHHQAKNMGKTY
jgi:hypothetical protein